MSVVISGISGRFPQCVSVDQFMEALLANQDLVTEEPVRFGDSAGERFPEISARSGKVLDWDRFDAKFFGLSDRLSDHLDPQTRKLFEVTYEAILDAGLSIDDVRGPRTGIYASIIHNEIDRALTANELNGSLPEDASSQDWWELFQRQCNSRYIAHVFDIRGPLYEYESACSSALTGLVDAFHAVQSGQLDIALICSSNLSLNPHLWLQYARLGMLGSDGTCRFLDANGLGYVKSEAAICLVLQRSDHSSVQRIRSVLRGAEYNTDGYKKDGITYPSWQSQARLIHRCYNKAGIDPRTVRFVEAHGTGTKAGDLQEMRAIDSLFNCHQWPMTADQIQIYEDDQNEYKCNERRHMLRVGSVKTNCGHAEGTSGLLSIAKVLTAFQHRQVPASIHFNTPNLELRSLKVGRVKPVVRNISLRSQLVSISSFGFGGSNVHLIMEDPLLASSCKFSSSSSSALINQSLSTHPINGLTNGHHKPTQNGLNHVENEQNEEDDEDYCSNDDSGEETTSGESGFQKAMIIGSDEEKDEDSEDSDSDSCSNDANAIKKRQAAISRQVQRNGGLPKLLHDCRLVLVSARTSTGAQEMLEQLVQQLCNDEISESEMRLLQKFALNQQQAGFTYGGYLIYERNNNQTELHTSPQSMADDGERNLAKLLQKSSTICKEIEQVPETDIHYANPPNSRPILFVLPGLGCQWDGMGASLSCIPIFDQRLRHYCAIVQPHLEFDLLQSLTQEPLKDAFRLSESIYCLLGLAVFQMALVDLLAELGVRPDMCIGHSYGELICAWVDGLASAEETLKGTLALCQMTRNDNGGNEKVLNGKKLSTGLMAVLNCGRDLAGQLLKESTVKRVQVACDNSPDSVTVAGEEQQVNQFLQFVNNDEQKRATGKGIPCCKMAFHSELVEEYYEALLPQLNKAMGTPCLRSAAWITTSQSLQEQVESSNCLLGCRLRNKPTPSIGTYFGECIRLPVRFRDGCEKIAADFEAVRQGKEGKEEEEEMSPLLLEIAPRKYVGPLAKAVLPCELLPTLGGPRPGTTGQPAYGFNMRPLLRLLGRLHELGIPINLNALYPPSSSPSRPVIGGFLSFSSLIRWNHEQPRLFRTYPHFFNPNQGGQRSSLETVRCPLVQKSSSMSKSTSIDSDEMSVKKDVEQLPPFSPPLGAVMQILFESLCSAEQLQDIQKGGCVEFRDLNFYCGRTCTMKDKFELNLLPTLASEFADTGSRFELCCSGHLFATGMCKAVTSQQASTDKGTISNGWAETISSSDFYAKLCNINNYPNQSSLSSSSSSLNLLENVNETRQQIRGQLKQNQSHWCQQVEASLQLALFANKLNFQAVDCVYINHLVVDTNASMHNNPYVSFSIDTACATGPSVDVSGLQIWQRTWKDSQQIQFDSPKYQTVVYYQANDRTKLLPGCSRLSNNGRHLQVINLENDCTTSVYEWQFDTSVQDLVALVALAPASLIAAHLLNKQCDLKRITSVLIDCDDLALTLAILLSLQQQKIELLHVSVVINVDQQTNQLTSQLTRLIQSCSTIHTEVLIRQHDTEFDVSLHCTDCDLVICDSASWTVLQQTLQCAATHGQWIHVTNESNTSNQPLGLGCLLRNLTLMGVNRETILRSAQDNSKSNGWMKMGVEMIKKLEQDRRHSIHEQLGELSPKQQSALFHMQSIESN